MLTWNPLLTIELTPFSKFGYRKEIIGKPTKEHFKKHLKILYFFVSKQKKGGNCLSVLTLSKKGTAIMFTECPLCVRHSAELIPTKSFETEKDRLPYSPHLGLWTTFTRACALCMSSLWTWLESSDCTASSNYSLST